MIAEDRWIARLAPLGGGSVEGVLALSPGLDVWERWSGSLVVAATTENQLSEVERRRPAAVEFIRHVFDKEPPPPAE